MFAITADQIDSRHGDDLVDAVLPRITEWGGDHLLLPPDRSAGDELQVATADAGTALRLVLQLTRTEAWSVGMGIGEVRHPLPTVTRAVSGPAFEMARIAVESAKKRQSHFALGIEEGRHPDAATLQPLIELLLHLRARRTSAGWELFDLLEHGLTQADAASRLGITPQAVSLRAQAAQLRTEFAAHHALATLLADASDRIGE